MRAHIPAAFSLDQANKGPHQPRLGLIWLPGLAPSVRIHIHSYSNPSLNPNKNIKTNIISTISVCIRSVCALAIGVFGCQVEVVQYILVEEMQAEKIVFYERSLVMLQEQMQNEHLFNFGTMTCGPVPPLLHQLSQAGQLRSFWSHAGMLHERMQLHPVEASITGTKRCSPRDQRN